MCKKNSNLDGGNYRPENILSVVSEILEKKKKKKKINKKKKKKKKAIFIQLEAYLVTLVTNNIIHDYQSGFRSSFFTHTCLIHLLDHIKMKSAKVYTLV